MPSNRVEHAHGVRSTRNEERRRSCCMRRLVILTSLLCGCSTQPLMQRSAIIDVATEANCDRPGVRIDRVERLDRQGEVELKDKFGPVVVDPGQYAIAVACQNPLDETKNACTFWGHPNEYPTYKMPVREGIRYTFRCVQVGGDLVYRISESNL